MKIILIALLCLTLCGCVNKVTDYEKDYSNLRYELYPVAQKFSVEVSGTSRLEERVDIFLLDKQTGRIWIYNNEFASFLGVRFLKGALVNPANSSMKEAIEKYETSLVPQYVK